MKKVTNQTLEITSRQVEFLKNGNIDAIKRYMKDWYFDSIACTDMDFPELPRVINQFPPSRVSAYLDEVLLTLDSLHRFIDRIIDECEKSEIEKIEYIEDEAGNTTANIAINISKKRCAELRSINLWAYLATAKPFNNKKKMMESDYMNSKMDEARAWLQIDFPQLYEAMDEFITAGYIEEKGNKFEWKLSISSLVMLCDVCGMNSWKKIAEYFICDTGKNKDKKISEKSLKTMAQNIRDKYSRPKDWPKVEALIED